MLVFRQLFDQQSSTYTYLLGDGETREAVVIDPVFEQARRDAALIADLDLKLVAILDTHVHADHVTGAWLLRRLAGGVVALAASAGAEGADRYLADGDTVAFGKRSLRVRATPGHTAGCLTFVLDDRSMAFTGDALLIRGSGRTDFQQGDARVLFHSVRDRILSLPGDCLLYPAHDYRGMTVTSVREENLYNPRLGSAVEVDDFVGHMANLNLAHPKKLDVAVPANLRCGRPDDESLATATPTWAPLRYNFSGTWEIQPHALEELPGKVQVLDVREPAEIVGPLGCFPGAIVIPLGSLRARAGELDRGRPVVAVCRSGSRSAQAIVILREAGFVDLANLAGGTLRWRSEGPVADGGGI